MCRVGQIALKQSGQQKVISASQNKQSFLSVSQKDDRTGGFCLYFCSLFQFSVLKILLLLPCSKALVRGSAHGMVVKEVGAYMTNCVVWVLDPVA